MNYLAVKLRMAQYGWILCTQNKEFQAAADTTGGAAGIIGKNHNAHKPVKWNLFFI